MSLSETRRSLVERLRIPASPYLRIPVLRAFHNEAADRIEELERALAEEKKLSAAISRDCNATALERNAALSAAPHVAPNCPYRSYKDHDPANCGHCSSPSTTPRKLPFSLPAYVGDEYQGMHTVFAADHAIVAECYHSGIAEMIVKFFNGASAASAIAPNSDAQLEAVARTAARSARSMAIEDCATNAGFTREDAAKLVERKAQDLANEYCHGDAGPDGYTWTNKEAEWQAILLDELAQEFRSSDGGAKVEP